MSSRIDDDDQPPDWCRFFDADQYERFLRLVRQDLAGRELEFAIDDGVVWVARGEGTSRMGLQNLAQRCHGLATPEDWPGAVADHFDATLGGFAEMDAIGDRFGDLEAVRDRLKLRLHPRSMADSLPDAKLVSWTITDDLMAVLSLDLPSSVVTVSSDVREGWAIGDRELFELARENVARLDSPAVEDLSGEQGVALRALYGESFFVASHLLHLAHFCDPPPLGLIAVVPHRHALLLHRIEDARVVLAINALLSMAHGMYLDGPGSLSDQLYWWRNGRLLRLPSERSEDGSLRFIPPPAFVDEVLRPLADP